MKKKPLPRTLLRELTDEMLDAQRRLATAHTSARMCLVCDFMWDQDLQARYRECCKAFEVCLSVVGVTLAASYPAANDERPQP